MDGRWVLGLEGDLAAGSYCAPEEVERARRVVGPGPVCWAAQVAAEAMALVVARMPEFAGPGAVATVGRPAEACTLVVLQAVLDDVVLDATDVPASVLDGNRDAVRRGIPLDRVLHAMWITHAHCLRQLLTFVQDPDVMRRTTELSLGCVEEFTARFTREYAIEQDAWLGSRAAARREIVEDLIAARTPTVRHPERVLGLVLAHRHVGVVVLAAVGEPADGLDRVAREIVAAATPPASVTVRPTGDTLGLWMTWPAAVPGSLVDRLRRSLTLPAGIRMGVGPPLPGPDGFRLTHLAAVEADRVAADRLAAAGRDPASPIADYTELDVIALLTADREQAAEFVRRELGPLLAADDRTVELRETLRRYLAFGRSRAAAAKVLHIAANTVGYRVRQAEQLLGSPLPDDVLRLRLALEIVDHIGQVPPDGGGR